MAHYTQFEDIRLSFREGRLIGVEIDGERQPHANGILLYCDKDETTLWIKNSLIAKDTTRKNGGKKQHEKIV